ncbi:MAG: TetR/AcrR family transcriptional regulator [Dehalococcoidia bacterium]
MARTRAAVLAAGSVLLAERGVHGITIEAIVERTGIAKTTIYRHWPSKPELVMEVLAQQAFEFPSGDGHDPVADLRACLSALSAALSEPPRRAALLGALELSARDPEMAYTHQRVLLDTRSAALRNAFLRAYADRHPNEQPETNVLLPMLVGPVLMRALVFGQRVEDRELDAMIECVFTPQDD